MRYFIKIIDIEFEMSDKRSGVPNKIYKIKGPIIIKKNVALLKNNEEMLMKLKSSLKPLYREDVVYETTDSELLKGNYQKLTVVNRLNVLTNSCRTIAKYVTAGAATVVKTSDNISRLIGQKNYDTVFSTLLSVIDQEQKIKAMTALLTLPNKTDNFCQTDFGDKYVKPTLTTEVCCQTVENCTDIFKRMKMKRRINKRQKGMPYVVKDTEKKTKKLIINPEWCLDTSSEKVIKSEVEVEETVEQPDSIPPIDDFVDNASVISTESIGNISLGAYSMSSHNLDRMIDYITKPDEMINPTYLKVLGGGRVRIHVKPEDIFHIATKDILRNVTNDEKNKLIQTQAYYDWKYCLVKMEDDNLVIHKAVINNDIHLLNRHCVMLKKMRGTVDVPTGDQLTAVQLSVMHNSSGECTAALLRHGADPLQCDQEDRTLLHLAAEGATVHLHLVLEYCRRNARRLLEEDEDLWRKEYQNRSDEQLALLLLRHMSQQCDTQGYTPLMLASRLGNHESVRLLVRAAPTSLDQQTATSGDTALYLAVAAACSDALDRGSRCKVTDNFMKTVEILVENGANPSIDNYSGGNVNLLLQEFNMAELSMLVANKYTSQKYFDGSPFNMDRPFMLVKDDEGRIQIKTIKTEKPVIEKPVTEKPVILQNVQFNTDLKISQLENNKRQKIIDRASNIVLKKMDKTIVPNLIKIENNSSVKRKVEQSTAGSSKVRREDVGENR